MCNYKFRSGGRGLPGRGGGRITSVEHQRIVVPVKPINNLDLLFIVWVNLKSSINQSQLSQSTYCVIPFRPESISVLMGKTKPGFYAVARGRKAGIFLTWDECKAQVNGFPNARYKKFDTENEAKVFIGENSGPVDNVAVPHAHLPIEQRPSVFGTIPPAHPSWKASTSNQPLVQSSSTSNQPLFQSSSFTSASAATTKTNAQADRPSTFDRQYSGGRNYTNYRGELGGSSGGFSSASTILMSHQQGLLGQQKSSNSNLLANPSAVAPIADNNRTARTISINVADYRRQLRVTEDRVISTKRKRSSDGDGDSLNRSNANIINPEQYAFDDAGFVIVYTDGACQKNGRKGAVAGIGVWFGEGHELNISEPVIGRQTNNTAEIQAAEKAILQAKNAGIDKLCVKTDSQFVINCITKWMVKWKRNGWKLADGKPVINRSDLEKLENTMQNMEIKWSYVAGHKGHHGNEQADRLAVQGANMNSRFTS